RSTAVTVSLAALLLLGMFVWRSGATGFAASDSNSFSLAPAAPDPASTPVLVELFTSEGCSSCPPADALLARLGRTQPVHGADIIALEEHVDYWDRLGWKDPYSSEAATERQNDYGSSFGGEQIYTPQMVVDGRAEFVGSSDTNALRAIRAASQAQKPAVHLSWDTDNALQIHIDPIPAAPQHDAQQLIVVIAENMLRSDVKRGENAGRALQHDGVVRQFLPVAKMADAAAGFSSTVPVHAAREWNRANLRAVVFVQERHSRHILAAAAIPFPNA
ncbi:MAG TPA: DUF1223 domain-containing protein, partial [Candidatus Acidoferrales bacterium]|nr:DUF1223 domain-containing protein [Candidatus Acidoferrales bacterium]